MAEQQAGEQGKQGPGRGELNNNWIGLVTLLIVLFLPRIFSPVWTELAIEASIPSALFFLIVWAATSRTSTGRYRIATTWYLAAIAITATLVGLVRFGLVFVIGGRAVFHASDLMNMVFALVLPISFAWFVSAKLRGKIAVLPSGEKRSPAGTDGQ